MKPADETKAGEDCCSGASCDCNAKPKKRAGLKTMIVAVILLAAAGVGAWSLVSSSTTVPCSEPNCADSTRSCCPQ